MYTGAGAGVATGAVSYTHLDVYKRQVTDCLNQLSYFSIKQTSCQILNGGDEEIRTPDPLLARQVLSQLSYAPMSGYALVSIIHSEESVIFYKLFQNI